MTIITRDDGVKVVSGLDCFIIPNKLDKYYNDAEYKWFNGLDRTVAEWKRFNSPIDKTDLASIRYEKYDYEKEVVTEVVSAEIPKEWIQIWLVDQERDENGQDSNVIRHRELPRENFFKTVDNITEVVPAAYFRAAIEGETITFEYDGVVFYVRLCQTKYRYARFGKFEDAYRHVTNYDND
jgi:hypothetical protein